MLTYRRIDYDKDIEQVVALIQSNLDPNFSIDLFIWKHLKNPFGKSFGFLALEDNMNVVGVRMMMRWNLSLDGDVVKAVRPVDTATRIDYRGKGVFRKLTSQCLQSVGGKCDLVFNTPNKNSLPGNLKMGWKKIDNLPNFKIGIINPFVSSIRSFSISVDEIDLKNKQFLSSSATHCTNHFLKWRYKSNDYKIVRFGIIGHYLIYKKSSISKIPMLIVYEIIGHEDNFSKMLNSLGKKLKMFLIYFYGTEFRNSALLKIISRDCPVVVIKDAPKSLIKNLKFSLGDLESKI